MSVFDDAICTIIAPPARTSSADDSGKERERPKAVSAVPKMPQAIAIQAMAAIGIDIRDHVSKSAEPFLGQLFDAVITVCDHAAADCPSWPGAKRIEHWSIEDPSYGPDDPATRYERFVATRDELARRIEEFIPTL